MAVDCLTKSANAAAAERFPSRAAYKSAKRAPSPAAGVSPARILTLAIRKRRELFEERDPDLCRELLNKSLIQALCKHLGSSGRARTHRRRSSRSRSASKRRHSGGRNEDSTPDAKKPCHFLDEDDPLRVYYTMLDEETASQQQQQQGDNLSSNTGDFEVDAGSGGATLSMVQQRSVPDLDYAQMEAYLDSTSDKFQFHGYVGHWDAGGGESETSVPETSVDQQQQDKNEFPSRSSAFSLTPLQPVRASSNSEQQNPAEKRPSSESGPPTAGDLDPNDPLEMNALFRQLYRNSYSIIEPSREAEAFAARVAWRASESSFPLLRLLDCSYMSGGEEPDPLLPGIQQQHRHESSTMHSLLAQCATAAC